MSDTTDADESGSEPEIACTLDEDGAERRRTAFEDHLESRLTGVEPREDGVTLAFDWTGETLEEVAAFVRAESDCCAFASFEVAAEPPYETVRLTMTGPEDAGELIREGFAEALGGELSPP